MNLNDRQGKGKGNVMEKLQTWFDTAAERIPAPVKARYIHLKTQFLAAKKSTQYAIGGASAVVLVLLLSLLTGNDDGVAGNLTFEARRGTLDITVLEGGALEALQSQEIRSQVKGREGVKILSIVEEGYRVTDEDVVNGKILVELDKAQLIDDQLNQEIAVETAEAQYIERQAQYEIQLNQNMTDLNDARQNMRFARLDFEKFLGGNIVDGITAELGIEKRLAAMEAAELAAAEAAAVREAEAMREAELAVRQQQAAVLLQTDGLAFDTNLLEELPPQMRQRVEQMINQNGGEIPPEMLQRLQQMAQGGFQQQTGNRTNRDFNSGDGPPWQAQGADFSLQAVVPLETGGNNLIEADELTLAPEQTTPLPSTSSLLMDEEYMAIRDSLDFASYADIDQLEDGEAKQQLRALMDELQVAQEELLLAQDRIEGQRRLEARGFITPTELEAEELNLNKASNKMQERQTALNLYIQYTFPKDAEQKLSDYENAVMRYQRQLKENIAEQAQEEARFSSAERKYNLELVKLADINQQIEYATIRAERPGLVVYGSANQNNQRFRSNSQEAVQEGATVRERQPILTIPDMREMAVKVNIHESAVQRVAIGQRVQVSVDAFPDRDLAGVVTKVAVVADSANAFMNPDLKVYPTVIRIEGTQEWLRPGMSAQVEIQIDSLEDVLYVPLQAVSYIENERVVYVDDSGRPQRRVVEVGAFSDSYIEITSGLREGEKVLLLPPVDSSS